MSLLNFKSAALALCFGGVMFGACAPDQTSAPQQRSTVIAGGPSIGGPFSLVNQDGKAVTEADFLGKPQLIYFGFAFCPDVCPTALQQMGAAYAIAGDAAKDVQPIFITVDAERDTPEQLALYVTASGFPEGLTGLTGTAEQIEAVKKGYAVYAEKVSDPSSAAGFTYDHSSIIYFMDEKGGLIDVFTHGDTPGEIAQRMTEYVKTGK